MFRVQRMAARAGRLRPFPKAEDFIPAETARNLKEYSERFTGSPEGLLRLMEGRSVLDLGSGVGLLATELFLRERINPTTPLPTSITSLNIRYGSVDYREYLSAEAPNRSVPAVKIEGREYTVPFSPYSPAHNDKVDYALRRSRESFLALDWQDLDQLPRGVFDVVVSFNGFPYFSDIWKKPHPDGAQLQMGPKAKQIFPKLAHVLASDGVALLGVDWMKAHWDNSHEFRRHLADLLASRGFGAGLGFHTGAFLEIRAPEAGM